MARKANPKIIGGFVFGAIVLAVIGVIAFGGAAFLSPKARFVLFFQGSLSGLDVGSPVTFRGVKIGQVTNVVIEYSVNDELLRIPVYIEVDGNRLRLLNGEHNPKKNVQSLIDRGLRAQLETVSLVTGQTSINFDFHPGTPIRLVGINTAFGEEPVLLEVPTIPTSMEMLKANFTNLLTKINNLPLEKISDAMLSAVQSADQTIQDADKLVVNANSQVSSLSSSVQGASDQATSTLKTAQARLQLNPGEPMQNLNETLADTRRLVNGANVKLTDVAAALARGLDRLQGTLANADAALLAAQRVLSPSSPMYFELVSMLREARFAANSIKNFAEYLQRNPSALISGNR